MRMSSQGNDISFFRRMNEELIDKLINPYSLLFITNSKGRRTLIRFESNNDLKHYIYNYIEINSLKRWSATMSGRLPQHWEIEKRAD